MIKPFFCFRRKILTRPTNGLMYLQQYSKYRQKQAALISSTRDQMDRRVQDLAKQKDQKQQLLEDKQQETINLNRAKRHKTGGSMLFRFSKRKKICRKQLKDQQRNR